MPLSWNNGQIETKRGTEQNAAELRFTKSSTQPKLEPGEAWGHQRMGTIEERERHLVAGDPLAISGHQGDIREVCLANQISEPVYCS